MAAAVLYRGGRSLSRRSRARRENAEENVTLDYTKGPAELLHDVLTTVVSQSGVSKNKKLGYYNAFVRFCYRFGTKFDTSLTKEEILCCLRVGLFHEAKEMRAACLRALRYICDDEHTLDAMLTLHIDYLVARSLDICLDNDIERIHALRLIRKVMQVAPHKFPSSLLSVMVSIANNGAHQRDKMLKTCLATLCELAFYNTKIVASFGGVSAILRNVLDCHQMARVNESLLSTILYLLNHPRTRHYIKKDIDLEQMLAPFTDTHYRYSADSSEHTQEEERENRFAASKMAIATIIKSWPGMIRLCNPDGSGMQSLIGALYLPNQEIRKEIMDIMYDVFRFQVPIWTEHFPEALLSVDPSKMRESWRLSEGFVAEEGKTILPHLAKTRPDLVDNHMALVLSAFMSAGVQEGLIEVIRTSDNYCSIRAGILLGELLHMANQIIPHEASQHSNCLPTLISLATNPQVLPEERNRAKVVVTCLRRHHDIKKKGPVPCSLFLDQILQRAGSDLTNSSKQVKVNREKLMQCLNKDSDHDLLGQALKDSQVFTSRDGVNWDWYLVSAILKWPDHSLRKLEDQSNHRFVRRLMNFFKPSNKQFSTIEITKEECQSVSVAGLQFIDFLLDCDDSNTEANKCIEELLADIASCLAEVRAQRAPLEAKFAPSALMHTLSQDYFLFIGKFSASLRGEKFLESSGVYQYLLDLVTITSHDTYIKLIVSSLDYSRDGMARIILSKALTASSENARLYTASLMRVLLRARVPFLSNWGMEMLVTQLYDQSKSVAMEALSVISEACEEEVNLHALVNMRPSVLHLGHKGAMLLARFLSIPVGFRFLMDANYVNHELEKWQKTFNVQYVQIVEERLNEALTTYEKTYDGAFSRRSANRQPRKDVFVPIHLYGQLVQHKLGFQLLEKQEYLGEYFECIRTQRLLKDSQMVNLKAALWAVGHMGTSVWGLGLLQEEGIIPEIIKLAEECAVFSVRGTAFYVLGLIASTRGGAKLLRSYGWEAVRHKRTELWPVLEDATVATEEQGDFMSSASSLGGPSQTSSSLILPQYLHAEDRHCTPSPLSSGASVTGTSPKATFFIDDGPKSRSSTGGSVDLQKPRLNTEESSQDSGHKEDPLHRSAESLDDKDTPSALPAPMPISRTRQDSRQSSEWSESDGFHTPPTTFNPNGPSNLQFVTETEAVVHSRTQSDPQPTGNKMETSVHFDLSEEIDEGQEKEPHKNTVNNIGARDTLRQPVIRKRSSSADAAPGRVRSSSFRDERSGSNESSHTNKSHSDSVNTDTTTSGFSSYESGAQTGIEVAHLSPIPSASSMATDNNSRSTMPLGSVIPESSSSSTHPADLVRRLANLKRMPSLRRRYSNPSTMKRASPLKSVPGRQLSESMIVYTSPKDAQGYATLREIQRNRTFVGDMVGPMTHLTFEESFVPKTRSLDFRLGKPGGVRQMSVTSLQDMDNAPVAQTGSYDTIPRSPSKEKLVKKSSPGAGRAEFIGLCLPVDVTMMFQVLEGEDLRSTSSAPTEPSATEGSTNKPKSLKRSISQVEPGLGLEHHNVSTCLACYKVRGKDVPASTEEGGCDTEKALYGGKGEELETGGGDNASRGPSPSSVLSHQHKETKPRQTSLSDMLTVLPGSVTSTASLDSSAKPLMSEDTETGRTLIHKEAIRLIVNLSSSVGVKSSEQGLLILKQKFGMIFQDLCLYSEVCYMLANYSYRLTSRRFIQELFQDVNFKQLYLEPYGILSLPQEEDEDGSNDMPYDDLKLEKVLESIA